jgi:hypothetical protein
MECGWMAVASYLYDRAVRVRATVSRSWLNVYVVQFLEIADSPEVGYEGTDHQPDYCMGYIDIEASCKMRYAGVM